MIMHKPLLSMNKKIKPFIVFPFLVLSACAPKQDLVIVRDDLQKLRSDSDNIKTQSAGSYSDVQQLRDEVARFQGSIEEINHNTRKTFGRLGMEDSLLVHKADDLESRLQKIEQYLGLGKEGNPSAVVPPAIPSATPSQKGSSVEEAKKSVSLTDKELLNDGIDKLGKKSSTAARESFSALMQTYPKSPLVSDAQFYIAESYFSEKWYEKAILEYQVVIAKYTKSSKRPAALYKQALSFEKIGDTANAKARFSSLVSQYPASPEAKLARRKLP
jgi:tol-pal system protein YbgF